MLSEKYLSQNFGYLWKSWLPGLSQSSVTNLLHETSDLAEIAIWEKPISTNVPSQLNDLIAEISFNSFSTSIEKEKPININLPIIQKDIVHAIEKMRLIRGGSFDKKAITQEMLADCIKIRNRLLTQFDKDFDEIRLNPLLRGFGKLASCHADIIYKSNLIEVKSSKYPFRLKDFRQIFLYVFLCIENKIQIEKMILINPRRGEKITFTVEDFCWFFAQNSVSKTMHIMKQALR